MLTAKQKHRLEHRRWLEYLRDASSHWYALADVGACDYVPGRNEETDAAVNGLLARFRRTFFPELQ